MSFLGGQEMIILLVIVLVLFGGSKVPQLMKGMGEGLKEFKKATKDEDEVPVRTVTTSVPASAPAPTRVDMVKTEDSPITTYTEPRA